MITNVTRRVNRPPVRMVEHLNLNAAEKITFPNGFPVYVINQGSLDICSIEINFGAGKWFQPRKLVARFAARMLREGTASFSSTEISEKLDFYGASFKSHAGTDRSSVNLVALNKHLPNILPVLAEIIMQPTFPQNELEIALTNAREKLKVRKAKYDFLADRKLTELIYGSQHPYGYFQEEEDYDHMNAGVLKNFYEDHYSSKNGFIVVAGKIPDEILKVLEKNIGVGVFGKAENPAPEHAVTPAKEKKLHVPMDDPFQSALRIGKKLFNKKHPDYLKLHVVSTILGGYFGSRLMSNIREDKGFTYGIHGGLSSLLNDGHFYISTEVGYDVTQQALEEIYKEINRLRTELVTEEELQLVKNYLAGKILAGLDGPFKLASHYSSLIIYGLEIDYFHKMLQTVKTITAEEIKELAVKYLDPADMYEVVVG